MLFVTNDSQVEPIIKYNGLKIEEEVSGSFTLSFTSFNISENAGHDLVIEESIVSIEDHEFKIKQLVENRFSKSVVAVHMFFGLSDERQDSIYAGTHTFSEFAAFALNGTEWTFTTDIIDSMFIDNFGNANIIVLVNALCSAYSCEYQILPNKVVHFAYKIGPDNDAQYRYGQNIVALSKKVDTTNLKTQITGYGANGLMVTYTSPNADNPLFGIRKAEPVIDERYTQSDSLTEFIKSQLNDTPDVSFELNSIELINKDIGERVWLIYEPLNIEFQTRILKQIKEIRNGKIVTTSVVLGNKIPKSSTDLLVSQKVEIDENKKEYRSRFEQTNELIALEVEAVNSSIASLEIVAEQIQSTVTGQDLVIEGLDERVATAESSITQQAGLISSKVSTTDYNGNTIASLINQSSTTIDINAEKINLTGAVVVNGSISGATNISVTEDIDIGNNLYLGKTFDQSYSKGIYFGGTGGTAFIRTGNAGGLNLVGNGGLMLESYDDMILDSHNYGVKITRTDYSGISDYVAHTNYSGFGIFWNGTNRVYFRLNGVNVGVITLEAV